MSNHIGIIRKSAALKELAECVLTRETKAEMKALLKELNELLHR